MNLAAGFLAVFFLSGCARATRVEQVAYSPVEISHEDLADIYGEAESFYADGDYADAARKYRLYLAQKPASNIARANYRFGWASFNLKDYGRAIQPLRVIVSDKKVSGDYPDAARLLGLAYYHVSDYTNAVLVLEELSKSGKPEVVAALADSAFMLEDFEHAEKWYRLLSDRYSSKKEEDFIAYRRGVTDFKLNRFEAARQNLKKAKERGLSLSEQAQARFYLGQLARKAGQLKEALEHNLVALKLLVEEDSSLGSDIEQAILEIIEESSISELVAFTYPNTFPGGHILLRMASFAYRKGNSAMAKVYLYRFLSDFPQHSRREEARNLLSKVYLRADAGRLGVIVPLSGSYAVYGNRVLQGMMMAVEEENKVRENKISLFIKDSGGNPDTAADAVRELVEDEHVLAIIGPVLSQTTLKAAPVAQLLSCPLITPSAGVKDIPKIGPYIFRNILTPIHQAHTLAEFAIHQMCINEFAILYPNNRYGNESKNIFSKKVQDLGGKVIFIDSYGTDDTDFKEQVLGIGENEPQAIFIPDFYDKVAMITPQLIFYARKDMIEEEDNFDVFNNDEDLSLLGDEPIRTSGRRAQVNKGLDKKGGENQISWRPFSWDPDVSLFPGGGGAQAYARPPIQLLGTSGWYSDKLIKLGGKYVEESVFTSGFFLDSPSPEIRRFVNDFSERFGEKPDLLASQSYDAARMIMSAIKQGAKTHREVRDNLAGLKNFPGITGKTGMNEWGESTKEIYILGVKKKKLVQLTGKERWLCRGGEEIDLGPIGEFQKKKLIEGIDYEGTKDGRSEADIEDKFPPLTVSPKKPQVVSPQPAAKFSSPSLKITIPQDDLFEFEDNF